MDTGQMKAVVVDTATAVADATSRMTWKLTLRGVVAAGIHGSITALAVVFASPGNFDLYSKPGLIALLKICGIGFVPSAVLYLKGLFEASPPKTWDGTDRRVWQIPTATTPAPPKVME